MCSEYDTAITPTRQDQLTSELQGSSCLFLLGVRIIGVPSCLLFHMGAVDLNSGSHACTVLSQLPRPSVVSKQMIFHLEDVSCDTQLKPEWHCSCTREEPGEDYADSQRSSFS